MRVRPFVLLACLVLGSFGSATAERPWIEVRSPHFRVLTDGSKSDARNVAREFEQMRYVFATEFPRFRLESGAPMTIFAARDEYTAKKLEPWIWKAKGIKPAGIFHHGWEKQYVMVRLDVQGDFARNVVYHEYTHSILHLNSHWLPTWLDEGMAEFYGYTKFEAKKIYIGAPTVRARQLQDTPIPVEDLMSRDKVRSFYKDENRAEMFYAESWALVHYLTFGPGMQGGAKLNQFLQRVEDGADQKQAFVQAFGSFAAMNQALDHYMRSLGFHAAVIRSPEQIDAKAYTVRTLTMAETEAELAGYHLWTGNLDAARPLVARALKDDPKLGLAHEENGFLLYADGQDAAATGAFTEAYALDGKLYLSLFAKTMLSPIANSSAAADETAMNAAMDKVVDLNPQFAPAYVQMARLAVRRGNLQQAYGLSRRAEELEPSRAGYHLLTGQILLRMGKNAEAARFAKYVGDHWWGPDHDEAVELWDRVPAADRPAGVTLVDEVPANTQTVGGVVQSTTCWGKATQWGLVLNHDGKTMKFHAQQPLMFGFSDTFWWGEDHFSRCRHLEDLRAVVRYRPATDGSYAGDAVEFNVVDDLPAPVEKAQQARSGGDLRGGRPGALAPPASQPR